MEKSTNWNALLELLSTKKFFENITILILITSKDFLKMLSSFEIIIKDFQEYNSVYM